MDQNFSFPLHSITWRPVRAQRWTFWTFWIKKVISLNQIWLFLLLGAEESCECWGVLQRAGRADDDDPGVNIVRASGRRCCDSVKDCSCNPIRGFACHSAEVGCCWHAGTINMLCHSSSGWKDNDWTTWSQTVLWNNLQSTRL